MAKRKKVKYNNPYKILNSVADEIRGLPDTQLVDRASLEYVAWMESERLKREDGEVAAVRGMLKDIDEAVKESDEYKDAKAAFDAVVEGLVDASKEQYLSQLKNLLQPYAEDIKQFKGCTKLAWDELNKRRLERR
jgi:hypothetical protein